jgi:hypothetical protein
MKSLIKYLECGYINEAKTRPDEVNLRVTKFDDIINKIIPFFKKNNIQGVKEKKNLADFCIVAELMKVKKHLTKEGLEQIKKN